MIMKHFDLSEFDSPDEPGSGKNMDGVLLEMLDQAREYAGIPFNINSGFRSKTHNARVGGVEDSSHTKGHAVDISCRDSRSRWLIVNALMIAGFNRIGIASTFIHVDNDPTKDENVIWKY